MRQALWIVYLHFTRDLDVAVMEVKDWDTPDEFVNPSLFRLG